MGPSRKDSNYDQVEFLFRESENMEKPVIVVKELNDGKWLVEVIKISPISGQRWSTSLYLSKEEAMEIQSKLPNGSEKT